MHTRTHTHTHTHAHTHTYTRTHMHTHARTHTHATHTHTHTHHTHAHTHTHTHTHQCCMWFCLLQLFEDMVAASTEHFFAMEVTALNKVRMVLCMYLYVCVYVHRWEPYSEHIHTFIQYILTFCVHTYVHTYVLLLVCVIMQLCLYFTMFAASRSLAWSMWCLVERCHMPV